MGKGIGGHESPVNISDTWLTPKFIIDALGPFDLDPCAAPVPRPWPTAARHITLPDDGLAAAWGGLRVWCNPPYGAPGIITPWLRKMAAHGCGTALIFARTETAMFHEFVWGAASAVLFLRGRLYFHRQDGSTPRANAGAPSCLAAYGNLDAGVLEASPLSGHFVPLC